MEVRIESMICLWDDEIPTLFLEFVNLLTFCQGEEELRRSVKEFADKHELDKFFLYGFGSHHFYLHQRYTDNPEMVMRNRMGLQGAGKTTTTAKIAGKLKTKGKKTLLAACDVYRPAAIEQLQINGEKQGVEVFSMGNKNKPADIAKAAVEHAKKEDCNVLIIDTAGRLHVDEEMMDELVEIKEAVDVFQTILVVDAMTGQDAVNVASTFNDKIGIDGVVLTKLDGDTRGGAALSIRAVTGKPILYAGMGEKLSDLEQFYPDRMASRILGMGDVLTMIEKAQENLDEEKAKELEQKMRKNEFDFEMYLESMSQMKKMGGLSSLMGMMPGLGLGGGKMPEIDTDEAEKNMPGMKEIM